MENLVKIFAENVARGNFVQIGPNFPAKSFLAGKIRRIWSDVTD